MRFGILGPLEVTESEQLVHVGGPKVRTLLAVLLVHANEVVSADELGEALWPSASDGVLNALQTQVSRLRASIDPGGERRRLLSQTQGYLLRIAEDELDATVFEALSDQARAALAGGDPASASTRAERALALWRGRALDEFAHQPFAEAHAAQLEEQRLLTIECRVDAELALGRHRELVGDLSELVAQHPLRELLWGKLMLALYRSGRQSEALRTYERLRGRLVEELGINPSADLAGLEQAILAQDPGLAWQPPALPSPPEASTRTATAPTTAVAPSAPARQPEAVGTKRPVTFLFTDVEQSTALWDRDPRAMGAALRQHDAVVRDAIEAQRGYVFGRPGDGFCAVFDRAGDAVAAAVEVQRQLARVAGAAAAPLRVRVAVHTGDAEQREGNYFGPTPSRTARMRDAGHGGQVLVSAATRELVVDALPPEVELTDIGTWLFEGFSRPERVYQLEHPDLPRGFPPLRSGRSRTTRLPRHTTSFVGRHRESEATVAALRTGHLVTVTGEGGIGKTRLALEVAQRADAAEYPDGVCFCDVSSVGDAEGVAEAVAAALELATPAGTDVRAQVTAALQSSRLLLLIDNSEQLRDAVAELVGQFLAAGCEAKVLATGRAPLRVGGEHVIPLEPLGLPEPEAADPADAPAVQLLVDRARAAGAAVDRGDPALVEIARQLDGVPLAIELAAPRLATMSPAALLARLDRRFELLTGSTTGPPRQRTLRATIDWSFNLLNEEAQRLFAALSVFQGGWTLDAAEAVTVAVGLDAAAVAPLIADLAEHSMIRVDLPAQSTARYRMLETLRAYGYDHLGEVGRRDAVAESHARYFIDLAETAARHRRGPLEPAWVTELDLEFDNLRAAYRWAVDTGRAAEGLRLLAALAEDIMRERFELGRWAEVLAALPSAADEPGRAVALAIAGHTALVEYRMDDALRLSREALDVESATGAAPSWIPQTTLALLTGLGFAEGDFREHLDAMADISRRTGDPLAAAVADFDRCLIASLMGEAHKGRRAAARLLELGTSHMNPTMLAMGLLSQGRASAATDPAEAARLYHDALAAASSVHNGVLVQHALRAILELNALAGDRAGALTSLREVAASFEKSGNVSEQLQTVVSMLDSLVALGAWETLATICGALAQSPWRRTAAAREIEQAVVDGLGRSGYTTARRRGTAMQPSDLVAFVSAFIREVVDDG